MKLIDLYKFDVTSVMLRAPLGIPRAAFRSALPRHQRIEGSIEEDEVAALSASYSRRRNKNYVSTIIRPSKSKTREGRIIMSFSRFIRKGIPTPPMRTLIEPLDTILRHEDAEVGAFDISIRCRFNEGTRESWALNMLNLIGGQFDQAVARGDSTSLQLSGLRLRGEPEKDSFSSVIVERVAKDKIQIVLNSTGAIELTRGEGALELLAKLHDIFAILINFIYFAKESKNG